MNRGKICVSVCGKDAGEVLERMSRAGDDADVVEIRFDCVEPAQIDPLIQKLRSVSQPLLITFRPREQGGHRDLTDKERGEFWNAISTFKAKDLLVDHELDLAPTDGFDPKRSIVSLHDFDRSPE